MKAQTAVLLHTESPAICLQFMNVQMQAEGYDCGLFAVETGKIFLCATLHNLFMFIPIYIYYHGHAHFVQILYLFVNLLAITMPY